MSSLRQVLSGAVPREVQFEVSYVACDGHWEAIALVGAPLINERIQGLGLTPVSALIDAEINLLKRLKRVI